MADRIIPRAILYYGSRTVFICSLNLEEAIDAHIRDKEFGFMPDYIRHIF